jgi:hypothetical protein
MLTAHPLTGLFPGLTILDLQIQTPSEFVNGSYHSRKWEAKMGGA